MNTIVEGVITRSTSYGVGPTIDRLTNTRWTFVASVPCAAPRHDHDSVCYRETVMTKTCWALLGAMFALLLHAPEVGRPACAAEEPPPAGTMTPAESQAFASLMAESMMRMHEGMNVRPTHDPDRDFAAMMVPHHQGAVDMALVELRFGHDPRLRRLAEGIIVEQRQEIEVMQRILANGRR